MQLCCPVSQLNLCLKHQYVSMWHFSDTKCVWFFHTKPVLQHQVCVKQFSSDTNVTDLRLPFHKTAPNSGASLKWGPQESHTSAWLTASLGVPTTTSPDSLLTFTSYPYRIQLRNSQWRGCIAQGIGWGLGDEQLPHHLASVCSPTYKLPKSSYSRVFVSVSSHPFPEVTGTGQEGCKSQPSNQIFGLSVDQPPS